MTNDGWWAVKQFGFWFGVLLCSPGCLVFCVGSLPGGGQLLLMVLSGFCVPGSKLFGGSRVGCGSYLCLRFLQKLTKYFREKKCYGVSNQRGLQA